MMRCRRNDFSSSVDQIEPIPVPPSAVSEPFIIVMDSHDPFDMGPIPALPL